MLDLVHDNLCGSITPATPGGRRHFLLLIDDLSWYMWVRLLRSKDEAPAAIKQWQALVEVETGEQSLRGWNVVRESSLFTGVSFSS